MKQSIKESEALLNTLRLNGHDFIIQAYIMMLNRNPDESGLMHYSRKLNDGVEKIEILRELMKSKEAKLRKSVDPKIKLILKTQGLYNMSIIQSLKKILQIKSFKKIIILKVNQLEQVLAGQNKLIAELRDSLKSEFINNSDTKVVPSEIDGQYDGRQNIDNLHKVLQEQEELIAKISNSSSIELHSEFDAEWYLSVYTDVAASNLDPFEHYINHGKSEGRRPSSASLNMDRFKSPPHLFNPVLERGFSSMDVNNLSVDIIVCVHNALEDVKKCLDSLLATKTSKTSIIIVDDGSGVDTENFLKKFSIEHDTNLIRNDKAKGYTFAANQGLRQSKSDYVVLLNSDTITTTEWISKLIRCLNSSKNVGIVGPLSNTASWQSIPTVFDFAGDWASNPLPKDVSIQQMAELVQKYSKCSYPRMSFLNGFCMMIKREVINNVGIFDENNFGMGYGEENDFCLRARKSGWELAIADDTYIFHAQSKSYSTEKRLKLAEHASLQLSLKHGNQIINQGVEQCKSDRALLSIRAQSSVISDRDKFIKIGSNKFAGKKILIVLPIMHSGGGANVIITEAKAISKMNVSVEVANLHAHKLAFQASYQNLGVPVVYFNDPSEIAAIGHKYDAVIATTNNSVIWLKNIVIDDKAQKPVLAYYVQDYEPLFYRPNSMEYVKAVESYKAINGIKLLTKTEWNKNELISATGKESHLVGASYDIDTFRPELCADIEVSHTNPVRIVAMVRPSTVRRNPLGTMQVLSNLIDIFGDLIEVSIFGADELGPQIPECKNQSSIINYGHLKSFEISQLLSRSDIFIDMSFYQAMGLTAMEAMACGCVPLVPSLGGCSSFAVNDYNSIIVDTFHNDKVLLSASELIKNTSKRKALQANGISSIAAHFPERSAYNILFALFGQFDISVPTPSDVSST
jgi:GT2 family glycosyltransferase/glycosyltransferase involved in cell wall biosynthesis